MMPGVTLQEIRDAILDAYEEDELRQTVRTMMDVRLNNVIKPASFETRVFDFIEWAERQGRDVELVQVTAKSRPRNAKMQAVYRKYGMSIPAYVELGGTTVAQAPTDTSEGGLEKIIKPHLSFADFGIWRERMTQVEGRVCQITLDGAAQGTGFLVSRDAVLTNYHVMEPVLKGTNKPTDVECVWDFKLLKNGTTSRTPVKLHATDWLIDHSPYSKAEADGKPDQPDPTTEELDYAVIRLAQPVGAEPWARNPSREGGATNRGWLRVPDAAPTLKSPMGVLIAQHPNGYPLKLAVDTEAIDQAKNLWLNGAKTRVRYATNTLGGSSGSPVFDLEWNLIALHHYGDPAYNHPPKYNQGVPIHLIRERLAKEKKADVLGGEPA
jgi:hypothetical protein